MKLPNISALSLAASLLIACEDNSKTPYLEFAGGGFIFNYRNADAFYGFVVRPKKPLPEGSALEARFEMPGGAPDYIITAKAEPGQLQYSFKTGTLRGIVKGHEYKAAIRIVDGATGAEIARYEKTFHTDVDQASLPDKPLVVGPAYQPPQ
jgi:hypothetical protein